MVTQLDDRGSLEHALFVYNELAVLEAVDIRLDEKQVGATLHRQEATTRNVDTVSVPEVLDSSTGGGLQLEEKDETASADERGA